MPELNSTTHEHYCSLRANGAKKAEAYRKAGFKAKNASQGAWKLEKNKAVIDRIAELRELVREKALQRTAVSRGMVIDGISEIARECGKPGVSGFNPTAALRGYELLGKELGMFIERRENRTVSEFSTKEELETERKRLQEEIAKLKAANKNIVGDAEKPGQGS